MMVALRWLKKEQGQITQAIIRQSSQPRVNSTDNNHRRTGLGGEGVMDGSLTDAFRFFLPLCVCISLILPLRLPACQPASSKIHTLSHRSDICLKQFDVLTWRNMSLKWLHVVCFGISVSKIACSLVSQHSHWATCVCLSASGRSHAPVGVWSYSSQWRHMHSFITDTHIYIFVLLTCSFSSSFSLSPDPIVSVLYMEPFNVPLGSGKPHIQSKWLRGNGIGRQNVRGDVCFDKVVTEATLFTGCITSWCLYCHLC